MQVFEQDDELVAAEAGDGVAGSQAGLEPLGDLDQQLDRRPEWPRLSFTTLNRSRSMNSTRVDRVGAGGAGVGLLQPVDEQRPVRQAGEPVVERLVGELLLERLALGDVAESDDRADDLAVAHDR